ncbi:MAG: response regulator [Calditrichia bacterium]
MTHSFCDILLVEDNPVDIELTLRALKKNQVTNRITVARDGEEALDYLFNRGKYAGNQLQRLPRMILLDLKLPKVDGFGVLQEIKGHRVLQIIPVIILTSSNQEIDLLKCYRLGANSYIVKPVDFDIFMNTVKHLGEYWFKINQIPETPVWE